MATPLYNTDIIPLTSRPTLTVMDDGDYFAILDTSTGKISKILKTNLVLPASQVGYNNATSGLTATQVQAALDELVVNLGSSDSAISALGGRLDILEADELTEGSIAYDIKQSSDALKGVGYTEGTLKTHEDRLDTLEGADTIEGSVANTVKDAVDPIIEDVESLKESVDVLTERGRHIYGIDLNESTGVVTPLYDRIGKTFAVNQGSYTHPTNDFDSLYPWSAIRQVKMNDAGVVTSTRGDDAYAADTNDVMGALPKFWSRDEKVTIDGVVHHRMLITDQPGLYPAEGLFIDVDGTEHEYKYRGRLHASVDGSGKIGSQPDRYPLVNTSMTSYRSKCASKGSRWHLYDKRWQHALWMLMVIEAGSMNLRSSYGGGVNATPFGTASAYQITVAQTAQASVIMATATANLFKAGMMVQVGTTYSNENVAANRKVISVEAYDETSSRVNLSGDAFDSTVGNFCVARCQPVTGEMLDIFEGGSGFYRPAGYANSQCNVCYRGFWDLWGNAWNWLDGVLKQDGRFYVCFDPTKYGNADDSTASKYPAVADGWVDIGYIRNIPNGWQKTRKIYSDGLHEITLPETTGGSSTAWICAYLYYFGDGYQEGSGIFAVVCGGYWCGGANVSILYERGSYRPSNTYYSIASSLILE